MVSERGHRPERIDGAEGDGDVIEPHGLQPTVQNQGGLGPHAGTPSLMWRPVV